MSTPVRKKHYDISESLMNKLWNLISLFIETTWVDKEYDYYSSKEDYTNYMNDAFLFKFSSYFWLNKDSLNRYMPEFKEYVYNDLIWKNYNNIFKILEFFYKDIFMDDNKNKIIIKEKVNKILTEENSYYRLFDSWDFVKMTNEDEIKSVEKASKSKYWNVDKHFESAKKLLNNWDYRNSIKESLSAVEAICCNIVWKEKATLWAALKQLKEKWIYIHPALEQWFEKIYWYVSDDWWIRHNLKQDFQEPTVDDAKYWLVSCSAFVNYLGSKSN